MGFRTSSSPVLTNRMRLPSLIRLATSNINSSHVLQTRTLQRSFISKLYICFRSHSSKGHFAMSDGFPVEYARKSEKNRLAQYQSCTCIKSRTMKGPYSGSSRGVLVQLEHSIHCWSAHVALISWLPTKSACELRCCNMRVPYRVARTANSFAPLFLLHPVLELHFIIAA